VNIYSGLGKQGGFSEHWASAALFILPLVTDRPPSPHLLTYLPLFQLAGRLLRLCPQQAHHSRARRQAGGRHEMREKGGKMVADL
jgi:hypothetical protein